MVGRLYGSSSYCLHSQPESEKCWNDTVFSPPHLPCRSRKMPPERMIQKRLSSYNSYTDATIGRFGGIFRKQAGMFVHLQQTFDLILAVIYGLVRVHQQGFLDQENSFGNLVFLDST